MQNMISNFSLDSPQYAFLGRKRNCREKHIAGCDFRWIYLVAEMFLFNSLEFKASGAARVILPVTLSWTMV